MDDTNREDRIRDRAYQLWEGEGKPEGRHEQHWQQAAGEIEGEQFSATDTEAHPDGSPGVGADLQPGSLSPDGGPAPDADRMAAKEKDGRGISGRNRDIT